ncbi:hypothetical protein AK812_SmicGene42873 [Symbiodinium microadriaticum]|uniref:Uncharacterized protein n=1 Tax=Symbiodinium microadriaticum TaxID=2951 RepID=A0A1Q9C2G0_SYMMI|nr:hypothetical protein AK812_SmicGene42873 [Symbiodinium microadriaticum]CAE7934713.1 unnamed protein product [Symbiodinium sp. KB8]
MQSAVSPGHQKGVDSPRHSPFQGIDRSSKSALQKQRPTRPDVPCLCPRTDPSWHDLADATANSILRSIEQRDNEELRSAAVDTLLTLLIGGCVFTRCPASFVVEAGSVKTLCDLANETEDASTLEILLELVRLAPDAMLPDIVEQGAVQACVKILENSASSPMDQLSALNLLLALSKRAPAPVAQSSAYEVVKDITNVALVPRRNKIMSFLRPLVQHDGDVPPLTNIRTGGLQF